MDFESTIQMTNNEHPQKLAEEYALFVQKIASQLISRMGLSMEVREDLVSAGYLGLVEAANRYEVTSDSKFSSFAYLRIRGAMIDFLRTNSSVPRAVFQKLKRAEKIAELQSEFIEQGELQTLSDVVTFLAAGTLASELASNEDNSEDGELLEAEKGLYQDQLREKLKELIKHLSENEVIVIQGHYFEEKSFREIHYEHPHLSSSWISRLHKNALKKLSVMYSQEQ